MEQEKFLEEDERIRYKAERREGQTQRYRKYGIREYSSNFDENFLKFQFDFVFDRKFG